MAWRLVTMLTVVLIGTAPAAATAAPPDRASAYEQWLSIREAASVPTGWTGSTAACTRGEESAASIAGTLTAVNGLRDFAGLAPVTFDTALNEAALAAALMVDAGDERCASPAGEAATERSLLASGHSGANAIVAYVDSLAHRPFVLDRRAATFGTGSTGAANALYVASGAHVPAVGPAVVSWPPAGWVPWPLVSADWSAELPAEVDASAARVSVTVDGLPRTVTGVRSPTDTSLAWTVAFEPADRSADRTVDVAIDGLTGALERYRYRVDAFPADSPLAVAVRATRADGVVTVAWDAAAERGVPVTGYRVQVTAGDATPLLDVIVDAGQRSVSVPATGGVSIRVVPLSRAGSPRVHPTFVSWLQFDSLVPGDVPPADPPGGGGTAPPASGPARAFTPALVPAASFTRALRLQRPRGKTKPGQRLAVDAHVRDAVRVRYQWLRDGRAIRGETRRTYTVRRSDRGRRVRCRVTAVGAGGQVVRTSPAVRIPPAP